MTSGGVMIADSNNIPTRACFLYFFSIDEDTIPSLKEDKLLWEVQK